MWTLHVHNLKGSTTRKYSAEAALTQAVRTYRNKDENAAVVAYKPCGALHFISFRRYNSNRIEYGLGQEGN